MTVLAIMFMKTLLWYFTFFSIGPVCTFIIIKSCSEIYFCLTNTRSFPTYSTFQEINDLLRVTVKYPTLNFKCFTTGFGMLLLSVHRRFYMSHKWKQVKKYQDINNKKYQRFTLLKKESGGFLQISKYMNRKL